MVNGRGLGFNVNKPSIGVLVGSFVLLNLIAALAFFNIVDLTAFTASILALTGALFLITETGIMAAKRRLDGVGIFSLTLGVVALIGGVLGLLGITNAILEGSQGVVAVAVAIFVIVEAVRK